MPSYPWLYEQMIDKDETAGKINALRTVGVPYPDGYEATANDDLDKQASQISENLGMEGYQIVKEAEIVALIAYLQRLGMDIKANKVAEK
jgi:cytochrome c oxidase cbb3-type subunit I/II